MLLSIVQPPAFECLEWLGRHVHLLRVLAAGVPAAYVCMLTGQLIL